MTPASNDREDVLTRLMAEYDDALVANAPTKVVDESVVDSDPDLAHEWDEAKHCIDLLDRARRLAADVASIGLEPRDVRSGVGGGSHDISSTRRLGRFEIKHELGRGGLGIVYLAHDPQLRRVVALKVPRFEALLDDGMRRRFLREAEAAARLSHRHLVTLLEVGQDGPICYLTSEYCSGPTLAQWLRENRQTAPVRQAAALIADLADAVHHAHSRGVLHRDIKPSNVLLEPRTESAITGAAAQLSDLSPKLTDFGMARLLEQTGGETRCGAIIGTLSYMSPEQAEGRVDELDARTDVYALGAVLYELLVGAPPYAGKSDVDTLRRLAANDPVAPRERRREIPRDLEAITLKCLARRPADRYATAHELLLDLRQFLAGQPTAARPIGSWERAWKWARRRPALAVSSGVAAIAALALLSGGAVFNARLQESNSQLQTALGDSRQLLYAADMGRAHEAWERGNYQAVREHIVRHEPKPGEIDLRTFAWRFLDQRCRGDQRELYRHQAKINAVACSPHGQLLATAGADRTIHLWDIATSQSVAKLSGHTNDVNDLAFSPDGRLLASAGDDATIRVWPVSGAAAPRVLSGFTKLPVFGVAFSPDGKYLAAACEDTTVRLWDTSSFALQNILPGHTAPVNRVCFSPDGQTLLSGSDDATARLFRVESGELLQTLETGNAERGQVEAVAFSHDGRLVATGSGPERVIRIWDAETGALGERLSGVTFDVYTLAFSPDDRLLASGHRNGAVQLWDTASWCVSHQLLGHAAAVRDLAFAADGHQLATASADGVVKTFDVASVQRRETQHHTTGKVDSLVFQPQGKLVAFADAAGAIQLSDLTTGQPTLRIESGYQAGTTLLAFSPDGALLAYANQFAGRAHVWDVAGRRELKPIALAESPVRAIAFTPDGAGLIASSGPTNLTVADIQSAAPRATCKSGQAEVFAITVLARSGLVITAGNDGIKLRNAATLDVQDTLAAPQKLRKLAVSADEVLLAAGTVNGDIVVWDLTARKLKTTLVGHIGWINGLSFCANGTTLASCGIDQTVRLWDLRTMQEVAKIDLHERRHGNGTAETIAFSPDGTTLATGGFDGTGGMVRFWSAAPGTATAPQHIIDHPMSGLAQMDYWRESRVSAALHANRNLIVDQSASPDATVTIPHDGNVTFMHATFIGYRDRGQITLGPRALASTRLDAVLGYFPGSHGRLQLDAQATWRAGGDLVVGRNGHGDFAIGAGASAHSENSTLGASPTGTGSAVVDGPQSQWTIAKRLAVGEFGTGELAVTNGGTAEIGGDLDIARRRRATGNVSITGPSSKLNARRISVGDEAPGTLRILSGGWAEVQRGMVGDLPGGEGTAIVSGAGSKWSCADSLDLGGSHRGVGGKASLILQDLGAVETAGLLRIWNQGALHVEGGSLNAGSLELRNGSVLQYQSGKLTIAGQARLGGRLQIKLPDDFDKAKDSTVHVMSYGSHSGRFAAIEGPPGVQLEPLYTDTSLDVLVKRAD
ncbi:MAG: protein kinase [Pirellulales bacterium]